MSTRPEPVVYQRNALAPGLLAAVFLVAGLFFTEDTWFILVRLVASIFALIVAWFAVQAKQWWWIIPFAAIAVCWNPIVDFGFAGTAWLSAQVVAAGVFLAAGLFIKIRREDPQGRTDTRRR